MRYEWNGGTGSGTGTVKYIEIEEVGEMKEKRRRRKRIKWHNRDAIPDPLPLTLPDTILRVSLFLCF